MTIGLWLRNLRNAFGLSQKRIAEICSVKQPTVSSWESGHFDVDRHFIKRICDSLELPESERLRALQLPVEVSHQQLQEAS